MTKHLQILYACTCIWLLASSHRALALEKWSRQVDATEAGISDSFDWLPLSQPADSSTQAKDRTSNGRVLTYSQAFPPNNRFSDLNKGFSSGASQRPLSFDFPYQFQNFGNIPQAQSLKQSGAGIKSNGFNGHEPTSQSFFKYETPSNQQNTRLSSTQLNEGSGISNGYQISHAFGGGAHATLFNSPSFNQQPLFPPDFHPVQQNPQTQSLQQKPSPQLNFINEPISLKNFFKENKPTQSSQLQAVTPQTFPFNGQTEPTFSLRPSFNAIPSASAPSAPSQQQNLQFLYVPYNDIFNQAPQAQSSVQLQPQPQLQTQLQSQPQQQPQSQAQPQPQFSFEPAPKYNNNFPTVNPYHINQFYTPEPIRHPHHQPQPQPQPQPQVNYFTTSTTSTTGRPQTTSLKPSNIFQNFVNPQYNTTPKPKPKPKAHQPPLAMFLLRSKTRPTHSDVIDILSNSKTIAVIDSLTQNTPKIFVGPSGMPTPNGYTKFDLPYLSQLQGMQDINDVAFFVAPLSYRNPEGFNKILLPEPHVGSIVINLKKSGLSQTQSQFYQQQQFTDQQITTHRPRTSTQRVKYHHSNNANRGNKFSYYQDPLQEVPSPQVAQKERPKKKKPQTVKIEQPTYTQQLNNPYAQFNPIPNQISTDDFYKIQTKPSTTSSTSTTSTTTSTTRAPQTYIAYNTHPQIQISGNSDHPYPEINQYSQQQPTLQQEERIQLTTRPPIQTTTSEEDYRIKQYYRQQEANRQRPQIVTQTNPSYVQVQYTPVNFEYEISKTTTKKPRITFYSPTTLPAQEEDYNTLPTRQQQTQQPQQQQQQPQQQQHTNDNQLPTNHRPNYVQNEITDSPVEYDPNPYQLPPELPQLTPNFPGLVNNLKETKDQENNVPEPVTQEQTTVLQETYQEPETSPKPTRKPINRVRKPTFNRVASSISYSESESTSRKPVNRVRRPFGQRNTVSTPNSVNNDFDEATTTTTRRPYTARNPLLRNPNRIRYQPTPEERQTLRIKPKRKYKGSNKVVDETEDLDYQRDVLKQNYPVFKPANTRRPTSSPTAASNSYDIATTEALTAETQQIYTVTPSNYIGNEQNFPADLLEPMHIAQQYNEYENNYGPGYFPNQEDVNPTESVLRNEINSVQTTMPSTTLSTTTTTTTTTEAPVVTRRSPFIRRNYPKFKSTTTETPTTTTPAVEDISSVRNRLSPRKVIKVRARTRRPLYTASTTSAADEENEPTEQPKHSYRKISRFNQNLYENDAQKRRNKQKFQLEGQESQWSSPVKVGPTSNFKPVDPKDDNINEHKFENEPEILTAGPETDNKDNYEIKVSANYEPSGNRMKSQMKEPNLGPEKSFAQLLEEVMGKAPEEKSFDISTSTEPSVDGTVFEAQKTTIANRILRRGKWKKTRVSSSTSSSNGESFEAAESQNLGSQFFNSLSKTDKPNSSMDIMKDWKTTTPITTAAEINALYTATTSTPMPMHSMEEYSMSTSKPRGTLIMTLPMNMEESEVVTEKAEEINKQEGTATRRKDDDMAMEDDLEVQPSLFSEVKKQLHELFSIEESDDTAVTAALAAIGKRRQEYTSIKRPKVETTTNTAIDLTSVTEPMSQEDKKAFHREFMKHVVYATSSPVKQEEASDAEICYRGRCIKSDDLPANHKLN